MPDSIFHKVPVQVPNLSGFNCSHTNSFSAKCATLMPVLVDPIMGNTYVDLDVACEVQLPPAVSDFYGSIDARLEMFFVPYRILWAGWRYFYTDFSGLSSPPSSSSLNVKYLPGLQVTDISKLGPGTLADMLGYKNTGVTDQGTYLINNCLPFLAYQMIYDQWYRDARVTSPLFVPFNPVSRTATWFYSPFVIRNVGDDSNTKFYFDAVSEGKDITQLRQRCWDKDYFTNATFQPQAGTSSSLQFEVDVRDAVSSAGEAPGYGSFTISSLRAANSLQQFEERNNLAGPRYADQAYARTGVYPADAITDRPIYLGSKRFNIYKRNVYQQTSDPTANHENPFNGLLANKSTSLGGFGSGRLGKFHATEYGFIFVMFSLVPQAVYSTGMRRYLDYNVITDFPDSLLQGVGDQPIYQWELTGKRGVSSDIFGYTQRFAEAKFMNDEVHGLLRDGEDLSAFQLQRTFVNNQTLGTSFLEIPQNYLDQITFTDSNVSKFGCWCQCYFDYRKSQPLSAYSLPTLGDPKDTHTKVINNGGTRL